MHALRQVGQAVRVQGGSGGQERQVERVPVSLDTIAGGGSSRWPPGPGPADSEAE